MCGICEHTHLVYGGSLFDGVESCYTVDSCKAFGGYDEPVLTVTAYNEDQAIRFRGFVPISYCPFCGAKVEQ